MRRVVFATAVLLVALQAWSGETLSAGLSVEPGGILLQDVPVGEARSVVESSGISFVVHNRDNARREYRISVHKPSNAGNGNWPRGYCEIPDPSWIRPLPEVLIIEPESSASFDVVVEIPGDRRLSNQKWAATLAVEGTPVAGTNVALALYPLLQIETTPQGSPETGPLGDLAVAPATLRGGGGSGPISFTIYNNSSEEQDYMLRVGSPGGKIPVSPGLNAAGDHLFVRPRRQTLRLKAGESETVLVDVNEEAYGPLPGAWEQLVFVEGQKGECTFVRFQLVDEQVVRK